MQFPRYSATFCSNSVLYFVTIILVISRHVEAIENSSSTEEILVIPAHSSLDGHSQHQTTTTSTSIPRTSVASEVTSAHVHRIQQNLIESIFPSKRFECKSTITLTDTTGFVKTPDTSSTSPQTCKWIVQGKSNHSRIVFTLAWHGSNSSSENGCQNYLKLTSKNFDEKYCSNNKSFNSAYTADEFLRIEVHSESGKSANKFYLSYQILQREPSKCRCQCANGECLTSEAQICNQRTECSDGSDEAFCLGLHKRWKLINEMCRIPFKKQRTSYRNFPSLSSHRGGPSESLVVTSVSQNCSDSKDLFRCHHGGHCIPRSLVCDGEPHCLDYSDEFNCTQYQCSGLICDQTRCVSNDRVCDQIFDCQDARDEEDCIRNSFITATLTASLICGLILVVAVGCGCKLFHWRNLQQFRASLAGSRSGILRNENFPAGDLDATLFRLDQTVFLREPPPSYASTMGGYPDVYGVNNAYLEQYRRYRRARRHRTRRSAGSTRLANGIRGIRSQTTHFPAPDVVPEAPTAIPEIEEVITTDKTIDDEHDEQSYSRHEDFQQQLTSPMTTGPVIPSNSAQRVEHLELVPPHTPSTPTFDCDSQPLIRVATP